MRQLKWLQKREPKLSNGNISVWLEQASFSDGTAISFGRNDKVIFVGPNNSGKSLALREIKAQITTSPHSSIDLNSKCVKTIKISREGNHNTLRDIILKKGLRDRRTPAEQIYFFGPYRIDLGLLDWFNEQTMGSIGNIFVRHINTENRLQATVPEINVGADEARTTAQQILYDDSELFNEIGSYFRDAFGQSLVMDYRSGSKINIHVGETPMRAEGEELISNSYVERVRQLPPLSEQGDGMRGYAGILFEALVTRHNITLIDEPEAFLHPPQMRKLARTLAEHSVGQLLVSTHSSDILRGFLDSGDENIRIVRIHRTESCNFPKETPASAIRELWDNPDLKYSNALEGIFHDACVLCEDDSDCRFYNAISDYISEAENDTRWPDILYVPCGGKHGMPKLASALHQLGVPVRVVVDIDAISEQQLLERLITSIGGQWEDFSQDWKIVSHGVQKGVKPKTTEEIKETIRHILLEESGLPKGAISDAMRSDSAWSIVKAVGQSAIPKGDCRAAFERLEQRLSNLGIFVVPEGQIEGFLPALGKHGPSFVAAALSTHMLGGAELERARHFVKRFAGPRNLT